MEKRLIAWSQQLPVQVKEEREPAAQRHVRNAPNEEKQQKLNSLIYFYALHIDGRWKFNFVVISKRIFVNVILSIHSNN